MSKALDGIVVLDLTTELWSGLGAAILGDFGADVIMVETLPAARERRRQRDDRVPATPWNYRFELANRNKMSVAVNLGEERGGEILRQLVRQADVVVTDRACAALARDRLDYTTLASIKPDIVYARGSGFGPKGPDRDLPAIDELAAARAGMMGILPQPRQPPVYPGHGQMYTAVMLAFGVAAAIFHREETGEGQEIDTSLLAGNMYGASLDLQAFLAIGGERFLHPVARLDAGNPMSGTLYPTADGRWVTLTMPDTDRWWPALSEIVGLDVNDPRFDSHENRCEANRLELIRLLDEAFRKQPADHWRRVFNERQMSADVIEDYSFPAGDEQAGQNRYLLDLDDHNHGPLKMIGFPIFMAETPARLRRRAPFLGQHTAEILRDMLGFSEEQITRLKGDGVVC